MDTIRQQVQRARRRLVWQQFLSVFGWSMFAALLVATIGLAIPKWWVLEVDATVWMWSCIGGALVTGLAVAFLATLCTSRGLIEAAIELDRRFGLKERVSSSLALSADEASSEIGRALLSDTERRVATLDVRDKFAVRAPWTIGLPLIPALLVFLLAMFVPDATRQQTAEANTAEARKVIKKETDKLKQQLQKKRAELDEKELKEAEELLKQLEQAVDELQQKDDINRKKAMIKINEMAKMVEQKREQMSGSEELRKQFEKLKDIQQGPGEKIVDALKQGDFKAAAEEMEKLQDKLGKGDLSEQEKEELSKQLSELKKQLEETKDGFEQAKRELEQQIAQKTREGDLQSANDLQKQLDKLNQMNQQMSQLDKMAEALGQCSECLQNGDANQALSQLQKMAENLKQMQSDMDQLQTLDEMLDQLAACKGGLSEDGQPMDGLSFQPGMGQGMSQRPGQGLGRGRGFGERPEDATDTQTYESKVGAQLHRGQSVVTGVAGGPNIAGDARAATQEAILSSMREPSDPLTDQQLPRDQRDHAKEYFQRYLPNR